MTQEVAYFGAFSSFQVTDASNPAGILRASDVWSSWMSNLNFLTGSGSFSPCRV